ncbi:DUF4381 domain-containing protein [Parendozoicomonas haliclonae]|uniref:DUF4381 domain-containing protein n=1 Tax=Parendozoicomonas haliclonae TaxID=1960125 RepID=A0A1X7APM7_9GAMM|nr:DUF4381 domain-containing protein [Parendozoicomonas haliclonae]SMA49258.1 hypothetical protein EHSB41UT_03142 [Parendozoicomonas haliclonae]
MNGTAPMPSASPMAQGANPLDALEPNILPEPISWFPPAPGWWILALLIITLITAVVIWLVQRHRRNAYRREALKQLDQIAQSFQFDGDARQLAKNCNLLLKATALQVWPREQVANLVDKDWLDFLARSSGLNDFQSETGQQLGANLYAKPQTEQAGSGEQLITLTRQWISKHSLKKAGMGSNHD